MELNLKAKIVKSFYSGEDDYKMLSIEGRIFKVQKSELGHYDVFHLYYGTLKFVGKRKTYKQVRSHIVNNFHRYEPSVELYQSI